MTPHEVISWGITVDEAIEPSALRYLRNFIVTATSASYLAPQSRRISRVAFCITMPAPRSERRCVLRSKISTSQPIFRSKMPVAKPVSEPPTIVAFSLCVSPDMRSLRSVRSRMSNPASGAHCTTKLTWSISSLPTLGFPVRCPTE